MRPRRLTKQKQSFVDIEALEQNFLIKEHGISVKSAHRIGWAAVCVDRVFLRLRHARAQQEEHARQMALIEGEVLGNQQRLIYEL